MTADHEKEVLFSPKVQDGVSLATNQLFKKWKGDPLNDILIDALNLSFELAHVTKTGFYLHCHTIEGVIRVGLHGVERPPLSTATVHVEKDALVFFDSSGEELLGVACDDVSDLVYVPKNSGTYR